MSTQKGNVADEQLAALISSLSAALSGENVKVVVLVVDQSTHVREGNMRVIQHKGKCNRIDITKSSPSSGLPHGNTV